MKDLNLDLKAPKHSLRLILSALVLLSACTAASPGTTPAATSRPTPQVSGQPTAAPASTTPNVDVAALGMKFVTVQPGSFTRGDASAGPAHQVTLTKGFQIMTTEVTQAQWLAVIGGENPSTFKGANLPVANVSWQDAQAFIQKLNPSAGYRLPSEAEWEYAARAGTSTTYACGDDESCVAEMAWYIPNSDNTPHPVGQKKPNAWGLYDMHGNVSEWVQDRFADYAGVATADPTGPAAGDYRLQRGGSFGNYAKEIRSAARNYSSPDGHDNNLGFRLVRAIP